SEKAEPLAVRREERIEATFGSGDGRRVVELHVAHVKLGASLARPGYVDDLRPIRRDGEGWPEIVEWCRRGRSQRSWRRQDDREASHVAVMGVLPCCRATRRSSNQPAEKAASHQQEDAGNREKGFPVQKCATPRRRLGPLRDPCKFPAHVVCTLPALV